MLARADTTHIPAVTKAPASPKATEKRRILRLTRRRVELALKDSSGGVSVSEGIDK